MEWFLSLFIFHDAYTVSFLVLAIAIIIVLLLIFNHKSPEAVVNSELGNPRGVEEVLRRVLEDKSFVNVVADSTANNADNNEEFEKLKDEVLDKDRTIAELNKKLTQSSSSAAAHPAPFEDSDELKQKIADLEAQLQEYELIEDDIADLSNYRAENAKLKETLVQLKSQIGEESELSPDTEGEEQIGIDETSDESGLNRQEGSSDEVERDAHETGDSESDDYSIENNESAPDEDLLSAFEKVVSQQDQMPAARKESKTRVVDSSPLEDGEAHLIDNSEKQSGNTRFIDESEQKVDPLSQHPKLKDLKPDSKEEADIFINELKSLRKGS